MLLMRALQDAHGVCGFLAMLRVYPKGPCIHMSHMSIL